MEYLIQNKNWRKVLKSSIEIKKLHNIISLANMDECIDTELKNPIQQSQ